MVKRAWSGYGPRRPEDDDRLMRIATWNINSVRLRQDIVLRLIDEHAPDILCLQETKCPDELFPREAFAAAGYRWLAAHGMKSYNGVAILSRIPFVEAETFDRCGRQDCRHVAIRLEDGTEIHNLYIPAGGDVPDPAVNEKFAHKLAFLDELAAWWPAHRRRDQRLIAVGDFNIAPFEHDVWSHRQLLDVVSHTPVEVEKLGALPASHDMTDAARHFVPQTEKLYTWWSYRAAEWSLSDRGRRLDHIWVTPPLASGLLRHETLRDARGWEPKPSDHVPVLVDVAL
jgi:exodeoxyribonuclease-3